MKRPALTWLLLPLLLPLTLFAATRDAAMSTRILSASPSNTVIAARFDEDALGQKLSALEADERTPNGFGIYLAVAGHGNVSARVLNYELGDEFSTVRMLMPEDVAETEGELLLLGAPMVLHDLRLVALNVRPVMRDEAGTVRLMRALDVEVVTEGAGGENEIMEPQSLSSAFLPLYRTFISNLDEVYPELAATPPARYLVFGTTARMTQLQNASQFQSWLDLKRRKGYTMQIVSLEGPTEQSVRQFLQQTYNDNSLPPLEYALIVGDHGEVPSHIEQNPEFPSNPNERSVGDNYYFQLAGGDLLPDVIFGRVSGQSPSEYAAYFAKAYGYETDPYLDDMEWFEAGTFVAGNRSDGGLYPVTPVWNTRWARERLMRDGCITDADTFYYRVPTDPPPGWYTNDIIADIDSGVCIVIYRGWAQAYGWLYPSFENNHAAMLQNGRRLPAFYSIVCGSGNFAYASSPCLGEKLTTGVGTPTQPQGAITFLGASDLHTNTRHNNALLAGIIEAQLEQGVRGAGALAIAGKLEGWRQFPLERPGSSRPYAYYYILHVFSLLGDPELQTYLCTPSALTLTHASSLSQGETLVHVNVQSDGMPVNDAVVTIKRLGTTNASTVRTNANGDAWVPVSFATTGTAQLTVWKSRHFMRLADIPIVNTEFDPTISSVNWTAGADNLPNPGETASFTLDVQNLGTQTTTPSITVTSLDERVTVVTGNGSVNPIAPGETATSTAFSITLGTEMFDGERPRLNVEFHDAWDPVNREMQVPVTAPEPVVITLYVEDGGNGVLEAGETAPIYVEVRNVGSQIASNLTATVGSWDESIELLSNSIEWSGGIPVEGSGTSTTALQARLQNGVAPGRQIQLRFEFQHNGAVVARKTATLVAGVVTITTPTGPDGYGYYAYEDIDAGYSATPTYDWVELDPAYGGAGEAHEVRDDTHFSMRLPQPFTYYGQSFDSVWICSNGWFSFERTTLPEFRNWELPSPIGAPSLVAPFWTDLIIDITEPNDDSLHYVWTQFFDGAPNRFVIQWRSLLRAGLSSSGPNDKFCTFEAILEYHPSGDGSIVFQYNQIVNYDQTGEGNYATVGMEDSYHERGLNLTYANIYPVTVDSLRPGRAIRITTAPPDLFSSADDLPRVTLPEKFALHEAFPNPFNPSTQLRFDLSENGDALLQVFDVLGREIATLADGWHPAGRYEVSFDARDLPSGLYFARLQSRSNVMVRKLMLLK